MILKTKTEAILQLVINNSRFLGCLQQVSSHVTKISSRNSYFHLLLKKYYLRITLWTNIIKFSSKKMVQTSITKTHFAYLSKKIQKRQFLRSAKVHLRILVLWRRERSMSSLEPNLRKDLPRSMKNLLT